MTTAREYAGLAKVERARLMAKAHRYRRMSRKTFNPFWMQMARLYVRHAHVQNRIVVFWLKRSHSP